MEPVVRCEPRGEEAGYPPLQTGAAAFVTTGPDRAFVFTGDADRAVVFTGDAIARVFGIPNPIEPICIGAGAAFITGEEMFCVFTGDAMFCVFE